MSVRVVRMCSIQNVMLKFSTIAQFIFKGNILMFSETAIMVKAAYVVCTFQAYYSAGLM